MLELDRNQVSRYPFLETSKKRVREMGLTFQQMLSPENSNILEKAVSRVEDSIEGREVPSNIRRMIDEVESDLLSYPVSRFLVAAVGDKHLIKWFSHREGERARAFLQREDMKIVTSIGYELGLPVQSAPVDQKEKGKGKKRFGNVRVMLHNERNTADTKVLWIKFQDFLHSRRNITGSSWDLVNRRLISGLVAVERDSYIRLIQERIREKVERGLHEKPPVPQDPYLKKKVESLAEMVKARKKRYSPTELGRMSITRLPPCMRQILGMSQAGENLPHHARFALVTFLNSIGMSEEEIFRVFSSAPDFKEDIVRYQVEHITGTSSSTAYRVPNCDTMKSGGICFNPDLLCEKEWMNSPLYYYKIKGRKKARKKEAGKESS
jgi:DNA primase large subunit